MKFNKSFRDRPEIPQVLFILSVRKRGGRGFRLLKIENLRKNLRKIEERGGVEPPENTKPEKKSVERPISGGNHFFQ